MERLSAPPGIDPAPEPLSDSEHIILEGLDASLNPKVAPEPSRRKTLFWRLAPAATVLLAGLTAAVLSGRSDGRETDVPQSPNVTFVYRNGHIQSVPVITAPPQAARK